MKGRGEPSGYLHSHENERRDAFTRPSTNNAGPHYLLRQRNGFSWTASIATGSARQNPSCYDQHGLSLTQELQSEWRD